ncbi:hypothetical protein [Chitinophaga sp. S165]|uniref:hypothetical protein n=1 Tax=Chitinophaga sp. S165 TaxID=2135462 RepID=UPI000D70E29E|nr:hypothetical protein [Chitinophaga sp. S165]PWV44642.1 hypothetical protein C7475_11922 [Chitinophaga sp. S165]
MRKTAILILCTISAAIISLLLLIGLTEMPNENGNGFTRKMLGMPVLLKENVHSLPAENIFGYGRKLYLSEPSHKVIYSIGNEFNITGQFNIDSIVGQSLLPPVSFFASASNLYIHENNKARVLAGEFTSGKIDSFHLNSGVFLKSLQLSDSLVVIRGFEQSSIKPIFMKMNMLNKKVLAVNSLFDNRDDAGFSTDGFLFSNDLRNRIFYVKYFENGIVSLDTNLNILFNTKTIDTFIHSDIKIQNFKSGNESKLYAATARSEIHRFVFANNDYIFIQSNLISDDETQKDFRINPIIDVYDQNRKGSYVGSFYLPVEKKDIQSYYINGDSLFVLLKNKIALFKLGI